jgi:hypothetical protein
VVITISNNTPPVSWSSSVSGFDYGVAPAGRRTVKTEPLPGSLVTVTSPPIMRASLRERARPIASLHDNGQPR